MQPNSSYVRTSVRSLVEFVLKEGDLHFGFQRGDRTLAGTRGHQRIQNSRPDGYQAELPVSFRIEEEDIQLDIFGRIDGVFTAAQPVIIDEIKTTTADLGQVDEAFNPLHWAQAKCYAYIYARQHNLAQIEIQLTYYQLDTGQIKEIRRPFTLESLERFFDDLIAAYLKWARRVRDWQQARDRSMAELDFPYAAYRRGQRELAVTVYKTIRSQDKLFVQAPTGVGKTIAVLFPAVKAMGMGLTAKIFYLTAKTPGRIVAQNTIDDMRAAGLRLKYITLTARDKICFCAGAAGDPADCEYTKNYYGRVKAALADAFQYESFTRDIIEQTARTHTICPFEFSLDLSLWVDCVICDYNYAFDPRVYLRRFFESSSEPYLFLVDEAHNLPDRARSMFSADLDKGTVLELRRRLKPHLPGLAGALTGINQRLLEKRKLCETHGQKARVEREPPEALLDSLREFIRKAEDWLVLNRPTDFRQALLEFYFQSITYLRTADNFGPYYVSYFEKKGRADLKAKLFCLDPAPLLTEAMQRSRSAIFFSATLLPLAYFQQILTGSADHPGLALTSPFPPENLSLLIHNRISTKYAHRAASYEAVAAAIETVCGAHRGNYLIYFPSYAYLEAVAEILRDRVPDRQYLIQNRGMTEAEREAFLAQFSAANRDTLVGLAVMGGIFGEGIDLVGQRLVGAVIVGVGLPGIGLERDLIKEYFNRANQRGFQYAYQLPGLNRVMQAAGRVIRTETDRGIILLIDDRFTQARYKSLFPREWRAFQTVQNKADLKQKLADFWLEKPPHDERGLNK